MLSLRALALRGALGAPCAQARAHVRPQASRPCALAAQQPRAVTTRALAGGPGAAPLSRPAVPTTDEEGCRPAYVYVTDDDSAWTKLTLEVSDFPGLVRVLAWALNGLDIRVQRAKLWTTPDGTALDTFWVTTLAGAKLSAAEAAAVAGRLEDLLNECVPKAAGEPKEVECGAVCISSADPAEECTLVKVRADPHNNGQLLELATTLSGLGMTIREAEIEANSGAGVWVFRVLSSRGTKLEYPEAASLLFLLGGPTGASRLQAGMPL